MASSANNKRQKRQKSTSCCFSIFSLFKCRDGGKRWSDDAITMDDTRKVWPSDGDKGRHWVAEPGIDRKAKAYIEKIHHQIRSSETQ